MIATVVFDLTIAILLGVIYSAILYMVHSSRIKVSVSTIDPSRLNLAPHHNPASLENSGVVYITGSLFFGAVDEFNKRMRAAYDLDHVILSLRGMSSVDVSGAQSMLELCEDLRKQGKTVAFCGVNEHVRTYFDRAGITKLLGEGAYYWSADRAILDLLSTSK